MCSFRTPSFGVLGGRIRRDASGIRRSTRTRVARLDDAEQYNRGAATTVRMRWWWCGMGLMGLMVLGARLHYDTAPPPHTQGAADAQYAEGYDQQAYDENGQYYDENGQYYDENGQYYDENGQYYEQNGVYYDENGQPYYADAQAYDENGQAYEYEYDEAAYAAAYGNPSADEAAELEALRQQNEMLRRQAELSAAGLHPMDKAALAQEFEQLAYVAQEVGEQVEIPTTLLEEEEVCSCGVVVV